MGRQPSQVFAFNDPSKTIGICVPVVRCYLCVCIFVCLYILRILQRQLVFLFLSPDDICVFLKICFEDSFVQSMGYTEIQLDPSTSIS